MYFILLTNIIYYNNEKIQKFNVCEYDKKW